jgi:propanol-preferring alcohol dehydrogenase
MKAMRLHRQAALHDSSLILEDLPVPAPGAGQVRLRVHFCGVCHTDLHTVEGDITPPRLPLIPGHQVVGEVDALGEGEIGGLRIGDRVGVPWMHQPCGICEYCRRGQENLCPDARFTGFHVNGGYAEYMLAAAGSALPLPAGFPGQQAAPLLCAGIIGYRSLRLADLQPGERLGLVGFGASAHLAIQLARYWGCEVAVFTRSTAHRQHALELGAAWVGEAGDAPPHQLDRVVIFAPAGSLVPRMLDKLRPGGTLAINAIHMSPIPQMPYSLIYGERTLRSVANATRQDGLEFLLLAEQIPIRAQVSLYRLEDANRALYDLKHSRINGEAVLDV